MKILTRQEKGALLFLAGALFVGQAFYFFRSARAVDYRYRAGDAEFVNALRAERERALRAALESRRVPLLVDPNSAPAEDLETLPGVGPVIAGRIIERRAGEPFAGPGDLLSVAGIGPRTLERMLPYLEFESPEDSRD